MEALVTPCAARLPATTGTRKANDASATTRRTQSCIKVSSREWGPATTNDDGVPGREPRLGIKLPPGIARSSEAPEVYRMVTDLVAHQRQSPYPGIPARMIPKVISVLTGSVQRAFSTIATEASRKSAGTTGYPHAR